MHNLQSQNIPTWRLSAFHGPWKQIRTSASSQVSGNNLHTKSQVLERLGAAASHAIMQRTEMPNKLKPELRTRRPSAEESAHRPRRAPQKVYRVRSRRVLVSSGPASQALGGVASSTPTGGKGAFQQ
ncbi:hypothetical protein CISG_05861 [Coccidioides immitis RMSCC 3703]|uniref:Uncharacterized protein n=1 Tax=Coccidioides immitis RMSCC 3703 TaxID=454286 RepID=A0A0J8QZB0_COCIT|nr:hypothetical protein CISG_05861 [Coccidioides immitis RMSCC 3703]